MALAAALSLLATGAPVRGTQDPAPPPAPVTAAARSDRILVRPNDGAAREARLEWYARHGCRVRQAFADLHGLEILEIDGGIDASAVIAALQESGLVAYAEPDYIARALLAPNDPYYAAGELWGLHNTGQSGGLAGADIRAGAAWSIATDASNVLVAIVDSGIRYTHEDLAANMWSNPGESGTDSLGRDKRTNGVDDDGNGYVDDVHGINVLTHSGNPDDDFGHGSHVAGTVGAVGNNGIGVTGVAWRVRLLACKFIDQGGNYSTSDAITALDYARAKGARIVTAAWGGYTFTSAALRDAVSALRDANILLVAAAGNDGSNNDTRPLYPASYEHSNVLAVAATDRTDGRAGFSNYGASSVDLGAPGTAVFSCWSGSNSDYRAISGTSMAAAHVAGACAVLWARFPADSHQQIINRILSTVDPLPALASETVARGRLNLAAALASGATPTIASIAVPAAGGYREAQTLTFSVAYSAPVNVTGTPRLALTVGADTRYATYAGGSGSASLVFSYAIAAGDNDSDGIGFANSAIDPNGGTIRAANGASAGLAFSAPALSGIRIDTTAPAAPVFTAFADDTGTPGDGVTTDTTLVFSGTAEPGCRVTLTRPGIGGLATVQATAGGGWTFDYSSIALAPGSYTFTATAEDAAGNVSASSGSLTVSVAAATTPPPAPPPVVTPPPVVVPPPPPPPVVAQSQSVSFGSPMGAAVVHGFITLSATASSGLPVTFALVSGNAELSGAQLTFHDTAPVVVRAGQAGNAQYGSASATATFQANKAAQSIVAPALPDRLVTEPSFEVHATATSGLPVGCAVASGPARVSGTTVTLSGASGVVTLRFGQPGNEAFAPAPDAEASFVVRAVGEQVYFGRAGDEPFAVMLAEDGSRGTLLLRVRSTDKALVARFAVAADGTVSGPARMVAPAGAILSAQSPSLGMRGSVANGVFDADIPELGTVRATLEPPGGATLALAGLYLASLPGSAGGEAWLAAGPAGRAFALTLEPGATWSGMGAMTADGAVNIATTRGTFTATIDPADRTLAGTLRGGAEPRTFAGAAEMVAAERLVNVSSRLPVGSDGEPAIVGFVIGGAKQRQVLIRAVGPTLARFGVSDPIAGPRLQVFDSAGRLVFENSNWADATEVAAMGERVGAFPLPAGSRDAAAVVPLGAGAYTAVVGGAGGAGTVLLEVYDAAGDPGSAQRLPNLSARGSISDRDGSLVAGFVIRGNVPKPVLVRGVGPGLQPFGVAGALADPHLRVFASGRDEPVAENADWNTAQPVNRGQYVAAAADLAEAAAAVGAFPLRALSRDAALIVTLAPGGYTAVVNAADGGSGVGLVEVYELPAAR